MGAGSLAALIPGPGPGRRTHATFGDEKLLATAWPAGCGQRLVERRWPDGALFLAIDHDPEHGFRIHAPRYGTHVVSPDGLSWTGARPGAATRRWPEIVLAQVLPTITALQGIEIMHASAIAIGGRAYGLVAASGVGKSSTAAQLVGLGATFVTDDVLAVEEAKGRVVAHPGPRAMRLGDHELATMAPAARRRLGPPYGMSDGKRQLRPCGVTGPLPLAGFLFLERLAATGDAVVVERNPPRSVPLLLASAYAPHVCTPARLERQLAVCAAAHSDCALWRVRIPSGCDAADVAASLRSLLTAPSVV